jgi:4-alpha-glucanotransferase
MDVLWFQRDGERFLPPAKWRDDAAAMTTTHDLPTVAGWWRGKDAGRAPLWRAFVDAGVASGPAPTPDTPQPVVDAAIAYVAQAPAPLALIPLEDVVGATEQPNVPGTLAENPNWRHRFDRPPSDLLSAPAAEHRLRLVRERRS